MRRSFVNTRPDPTAGLVRSLTVQTNFLEYDTDRLRKEADALESALYKRVRDELTAIMPSMRPSDLEADAIATAYARFIILRRSATREEFIEQSAREPSPALTDEDTESAERAWQYESSWARHGDISADSIRVLPIFIRGRVVGDFEPRGMRTSRHLSNGKLLSADTANGYSVYQVLMDMTVPSIDASEEFEVTLGTMLINDGPQGAWSPISNEFIGIPQGKFAYTPRP